MSLIDRFRPAPAAPGPLLPAPPPFGSGRLCLALQGGGAFGAFTWGVLDRLLEHDGVDLEAVSGASAGAINAVLLADGLRRGGAAAARENLGAFWTALGRAVPNGFAATGRAALALDVSTRVLSPYQLNPFNHNPIKGILADIVDFAALRGAPSLGLMVSATRVADGTLRIFREHEISLDVVMASSCLPLLHHAVEIEGEHYWDGGYAANPPLIPLLEAFRPDGILVVQIIPATGGDHPTTSQSIVRRLNQITFNAPLQNDMEAVATLRRILERDGDDSGIARRVARLHLHHVVADDWFPTLGERSLLDVDARFLVALRDAGRRSVESRLGAAPAGRAAAA